MELGKRDVGTLAKNKINGFNDLAVNHFDEARMAGPDKEELYGDDVDRKLWAGAAATGWRVVINCRASGSWRYVTPGLLWYKTRAEAVIAAKENVETGVWPGGIPAGGVMRKTSSRYPMVRLVMSKGGCCDEQNAAAAAEAPPEAAEAPPPPAVTEEEVDAAVAAAEAAASRAVTAEAVVGGASAEADADDDDFQEEAAAVKKAKKRKAGE
jgi:hypothetical protein